MGFRGRGGLRDGMQRCQEEEFGEWVSQVRQSRDSLNTETLRTAFETEEQPGGAELTRTLCPEQSTNSPYT